MINRELFTQNEKGMTTYFNKSEKKTSFLKNYKTLILLIFLFQFYNTFAQYKLSGKIYDNKGKPIEFVNIVLSSNSKIDYYTITDSLGQYNFEKPIAGEFEFTYSYINISKQLKINITKDTTLNIVFDSLYVSLNEVIIASKKPLIERKIDRLVFNVENRTASIGGDAFDVLKSTPGVRVSNDDIALPCNCHVSIMVNDKIIQLSGTDLIGFLRNIKSESISKIEVITNPSAKYDAGGNSGLINILLKKENTINHSSGNISTFYEQRTFATTGLVSGLNIKKDKFYISASMNINYGNSAPTENMKILYPISTINQTNNRTDFMESITGRITSDYQITKKSLLGFQYLGGYYKPTIDEEISSLYFKNSNTKEDSLIYTRANKQSNIYYNSFDLNYQNTLDTAGRKLEFDINYLIREDKNNRPFNSETFDNNGIIYPSSIALYKNIGLQSISMFSSKLDFEIPNKIANLSIGGKISIIRNNSSSSFYYQQNNEFILDINSSDTFKYDENIQAIYCSFQKEIKKWEFQLGLRIENTQTKGYSLTLQKTNTDKYINYFPTFYATYNPNGNNTFSFSYGKKIRRPSYRGINPFRLYSNAYTYMEGNPYLRPSINHNFEILHVYKNNLNTSFYVNYQKNGFDQVTLASDTSVIIIMKPYNFFEAIMSGINQTYNLKISNSIKSYLEIDINYNSSHLHSPSTDTILHGISAYFQNQSSFTLNKKKTFFADITFWYQFPQIYHNFQETACSSVDISLKHLFIDKKLIVSISAYDIFKNSIATISSQTNGVSHKFKNYYDNRVLKLGINYNFGNKNLKSKQLIQSNDEERKRTN